ncbi:thiamine pyrophosphate-dependent enzyme [Streptomyces nodosus]|uniref:hypothetical protein n=1 Tax=Streptomyces nodosus TaxID=40318 RepID=UPI00381115EA
MTPPATAPTARLTVAQALVRFLAAQYTERDGVRRRLIAATWGVFGHGNVAGVGQALPEYGDVMPFHQGRDARTVGDLRVALAEARGADTPTCVYVETETADTLSGAPGAQAWWDVPVAETATRPSAVTAREEYDRHVSTRRRHL